MNNPFNKTRAELLLDLPQTGDSLSRPFNELVKVAVGKPYNPKFLHEEDMTDSQLRANEALIRLLPEPKLDLTKIYFGAINEAEETKRQEEARKQLFLENNMENILLDRDPLQDPEINKILRGVDEYARSYNLSPEQVKVLKEEIFKSDLLNYIRAGGAEAKKKELGKETNTETKLPATGPQQQPPTQPPTPPDDKGGDGGGDEDGDGGGAGGAAAGVLEEEKEQEEELPTGAGEGEEEEDGPVGNVVQEDQDVPVGDVAGASGGGGTIPEGEGQMEDRTGEQLGQGGAAASGAGGSRDPILDVDYRNAKAYISLGGVAASTPSPTLKAMFQNGLGLFKKIDGITDPSVLKAPIPNSKTYFDKAVAEANEYFNKSGKMAKSKYVSDIAAEINEKRSKTTHKIIWKSKDILKFISPSKYPFGGTINKKEAEYILMEMISVGFYIVNNRNPAFQDEEPRGVDSDEEIKPKPKESTRKHSFELVDDYDEETKAELDELEKDFEERLKRMEDKRRRTTSSNPFA